MKPTLPHQICDTVHDVDECEILARSELEVISIIMRATLMKPSFVMHSHIPVRKSLVHRRSKLT